jgi:hypothetical protein
MRTPDRYNTECPKLGLKRSETMFREDMAYVEAAISNFRDGNYTRVIRDLEEGALSVIGGTAKKKGIAKALQIHCSEVLLARLYWTGKAYRASGAGLDAIACYRIVLS